MRLQPIAAALAMAALLILPPAFGGTADGEPGMGYQSSCVPEALKCLEKLEALGYSNDRAHHSPGARDGLLGLLATDPHCAMVLWGTVLP